MLIRNTSGQKWRVFAFDRTNNEPVTGDAANITAKISKDYGTATALADTNPTETEDGYYLFDLTKSETNAANLAIYPESSTADVQVVGVPGSQSAEALAPAETTAVSGDVPFDLVGGVVAAELPEEATVVVGQRQLTRIRRNDSYDDVANPVKSFPVEKDYDGWTGTLTIRHRVTGSSLLTKSVTVLSAATITCSLSSTDTAFTLLTMDEDFGPHPFDIEMTSGASKQSAVRGIAIITKDQTT